MASCCSYSTVVYLFAREMIMKVKIPYTYIATNYYSFAPGAPFKSPFIRVFRKKKKNEIRRPTDDHECLVVDRENRRKRRRRKVSPDPTEFSRSVSTRFVKKQKKKKSRSIYGSAVACSSRGPNVMLLKRFSFSRNNNIIQSRLFESKPSGSRVLAFRRWFPDSNLSVQTFYDFLNCTFDISTLNEDNT